VINAIFPERSKPKGEETPSSHSATAETAVELLRILLVRTTENAVDCQANPPGSKRPKIKCLRVLSFVLPWDGWVHVNVLHR
jgi:hypothetical protein